MRREREEIRCFIWKNSCEESVLFTKIFLSLTLDQWLCHCRLWKSSCFSSISSICLTHWQDITLSAETLPLKQRPLSHYYLPDPCLAMATNVSPLTSWKYLRESFAEHSCNNNCRYQHFFSAQVLFRKQRRQTKKYSFAFSKTVEQGYGTSFHFSVFSV